MSQEMSAIIFHGHIFKNAGSTFDWALKRSFGSGFCDHRRDVEMRRGGPAYLQQFLMENPSIQALSSHHLSMPLPDFRDKSALFCALLRHPIERVRSVYTFERRQKATTPGAIHAKKFGFPDYVKWRLEDDVPAVIRNYQFMYCKGRRQGVKDVDGLLAALGPRSFLGVVDRFDESMVYFEENLRANFPTINLAYVRQNSSDYSQENRHRPTLAEQAAAVCEELGDELADRLEECNQLDMGFYRTVNAVLDLKIAEISDFDGKLAAFQDRCRNL